MRMDRLENMADDITGTVILKPAVTETKQVILNM